MTSVETVSHLRENPFEIAREQLRRVAAIFDIDPNLVNVLQECKKSVVVSIPVDERRATSLRMAAHGLAVRRVAEATTTRGLYP